MRFVVVVVALAVSGCDVERCTNSPGWEVQVLKDKGGNEYLVNRHLGWGCTFTVQKVGPR